MYNKPSDEYGHIPKETVLQAVEDLMNGNRPILSRAAVQRRILEISYDEMKESQDFRKFVDEKMMRVKE